MDDKYYSSYRRFTYDWKYEDQEEYSKYEKSLEDLEVKEVISDEEYNSTVSRLEASDDIVGLENYREHFISESEYFFTREELLEGMKNLQTFYRVTEEKLAEDKRIRASYAKDVLGRFKASGYAVLRNVDVDSLSDEEAIDLHRVVTHGKTIEEIREILNKPIIDRLNNDKENEDKKTRRDRTRDISPVSNLNRNYYSTYRRFTYDWPFDEQEEYNNYEMLLDDLEVKEVVSDEEFNNTVSRLEETGDLEELENYRQRFVSESDYYFSRESALQSMEYYHTTHHITDEKLAEDRKMRASYSRDILRRFKASGYHTLRNVNVDSLNDEEAIDLHRVVTHGKTLEEIRNIANTSIRNRVGLNDTVVQKDDGNNNNNDDDNHDNNAGDGQNNDTDRTDEEQNRDVAKSEIDKELEEFEKVVQDVKSQFEEINRKLVLGDDVTLDFNDVVRDLGNDINELREMGSLIIDDMDEFRLQFGTADFNMTVVEIKDTIKGFTDRFKLLKEKQISRYNLMVAATNAKIGELKGMTDLEPEVAEMINKLVEFDKCDIVINDWTQKDYLEALDYMGVVDANRVIEDIRNRINIPTETIKDNLDKDISTIEREAERIDTEIVDEIEKIDVNRLNQDLDMLGTNVTDFNLKLEANRDSITEEEYNELKNRSEEVSKKIDVMRNRMPVPSVVNEELNNQAKLLEDYINRLSDDIECFYGHITKGGVAVFNDRVFTFEGRLSDLKKKIEEYFNVNTDDKDKKVDINQYNSLMNRVNDMETKLSDCKNKLKDPGMIKDADIYSVLNGEIEGLENAVNSLEEQVNNLNKPVKKEDRKKIDAIVKELEKELNRLEKIINQYKDKEPEKYNALVERLNVVKNKLDNVSKNYRKKCPLHVRAVKSAKNFYKKHKKLVLISAGLAALVLVSSPVLIPAVMHGNIMLGFSSPVLRPFAKFSNKVLGGMIGATVDKKGIWMLANGTVLNPQTAATSLLKGLALSGVGHAALVSPIAVPATYSVVVGVKKLVEKMKTKELKQKLTEGKEKLKENVKVGKEKVTNAVKGKSSSDKNKVKKADRDAISEIAELFKEFRKSGKSLEEFAVEAELTEEELIMMRYLITSSEEYKNMHDEEKKGGKGRK